MHDEDVPGMQSLYRSCLHWLKCDACIVSGVCVDVLRTTRSDLKAAAACINVSSNSNQVCDVVVEKRKYTADAKPSATATPSPHPSWGASSRIERGMDHVESEHALGNVPEDDCLSTSGQFSACSANTAKVSNVHATSSTAQPSAEDPVTVHDRDRVAEDSQPSKLSAEDVELSLPIQDTSSGSSSCHKTAQPTERQEADSTAASSTQVRASSVPLHANVKSSVAPMHRSHEETVRKLDAAIEQFGKEKQGYDLVGVAKAYVGFEKMVIEVRTSPFSACMA